MIDFFVVLIHLFEQTTKKSKKVVKFES